MLKKIHNFHKAEDGTALLIFSMALFIVIGGIAYTIDVSRFFAAKARLGNATEMAAVAVAQNLHFLETSVLDQLASDVVSVNYRRTSLHAYSGDTVVPLSVNLATNIETGEVTLRTRAEVSTTLLRALNFLENVTVAVEINAVQEQPEAEVVLVLEASNAMAASGALAEVKSAARDFIVALSAKATQGNGIKWGLVPFGNAMVNIAPYQDWVDGGVWPLNIPPEGPGTTEWTGDLAEDRWCVAPRAGAAGEDDTPPGTTSFPLVLALHSEINAGTGLPHYSNITSTDCRPERIRGLTGSLPISTAVASLAGNGGTAYGRGMIWAERALSPLWQGVWSSDTTLPAGYDDETIKKIAILVVGSSAAEVGEDSRLINSCTRMKQNDITLYVIGYLAPATTSALLQTCATTVGHYFHVTDVSNLQSAFFSIAKFLTRVRFAG